MSDEREEDWMALIRSGVPWAQYASFEAGWNARAARSAAAPATKTEALVAHAFDFDPNTGRCTVCLQERRVHPEAAAPATGGEKRRRISELEAHKEIVRAGGYERAAAPPSSPPAPSGETQREWRVLDRVESSIRSAGAWLDYFRREYARFGKDPSLLKIEYRDVGPWCPVPVPTEGSVEAEKGEA